MGFSGRVRVGEEGAAVSTTPRKTLRDNSGRWKRLFDFLKKRPAKYLEMNQGENPSSVKLRGTNSIRQRSKKETKHRGKKRKVG